MKYGLFSDVHSNLEALQAVLGALKRAGVDHYVFLGDLVGYGADPRECIRILRALIRDSGCTCVVGNHDYAACGLTSTDYFNPYAKAAVDWTSKQLSASDKDFLTGMKLVERVGGFSAVHANLTSPETWGYILDVRDAQSDFKALQDPICFIGHSHRPVIFTCEESVNCLFETEVHLKKDTKYIINVGSVGQPRDGDSRSSFGIYDTVTNRVELRRVRYDIGKTQEKIIRAGLPQILADRLSDGR